MKATIKSKEEINKADIILHIRLRTLNYINFETSRLNAISKIEISYIDRNLETIYENPLYKELINAQ